MTDEQRFGFLFQSIESHDRQISEVVSLNADNARQIAENAAMNAENARRIAENADQIAENAVQLAEGATRMETLRDAIAKLVNVTNEDALAIRRLARIADAHNDRISQIEQDH